MPWIIFVAVKFNEASDQAHANEKPINCEKLCQIPFIHSQNKSHLLYCYILLTALFINQP